jgi:asparagine synthase (glutamine-hydrolysing)
MDVDLATQLPEDLLMLTDKMSMAVSLECRVPLLDQRLVELAARMPGALKLRGGDLKHPMKRALAGILPDSIIHREKRGFGAPIGAWFRQELAPLMADLLSKETVVRRGLLDPEAVARTIGEHEKQQADRTDHLLALVNLEIWSRLYLDGETVNDVTGALKSRLAA